MFTVRYLSLMTAVSSLHQQTSMTEVCLAVVTASLEYSYKTREQLSHVWTADDTRPVPLHAVCESLCSG